jgi:hypothetical protein
VARTQLSQGVSRTTPKRTDIDARRRQQDSVDPARISAKTVVAHWSRCVGFVILLRMEKSQPISVELPPQLIDQYKKTLLNVTDIRLVVLLAFSSFEEVMKAFLAWRLSCSIDQLPRVITRTPDILFQVVLIGDPKTYNRAKQFAELRNNIAHKFHLGEYEPLVAAFVEEVLGTKYPVAEIEQRQAVISAVFGLALEIGSHYLQVPDRAEFPFPALSLELTASSS